jgi:hypothetical protein
VWIGGGLVIAGAGVYLWRTVDRSPVFKACIREHKNDPAYHVLHDGGPITSRATRLVLQSDCIRDWALRAAGFQGVDFGS